jgi:hypothetical protein
LIPFSGRKGFFLAYFEEDWLTDLPENINGKRFEKGLEDIQVI